jgi:hypothetical protein
MQQRVGTAHRLLCPQEGLPKPPGRKRPDLHRSPFGFFAPFPVLFGHRSLLLRLLTYSPPATNSTPSPVKMKKKSVVVFDQNGIQTSSAVFGSRLTVVFCDSFLGLSGTSLQQRWYYPE